jgi:GNAT superfamily N-acetyltransferase
MLTPAIRDLEAVAALGWQAVEQAWLGGWLLRAADGFTGRANSALPLADPERSLPDAVDAAERWYEARGLRPAIAIAYPMAGVGDDALDRLLAHRGWTIRPGAAVVMTAATVDAAGAKPVRSDGGPGVEISSAPDAEWLSQYHYRGGEAPPIATLLLASAPWQAFASVRRDGRIVAIGRVAIAAGWAGLTAIEVAPAYRRRGLATAIIRALSQVAAEQGAEQMYLQVEGVSRDAQMLYARRGFAERHRYHYRLGP